MMIGRVGTVAGNANWGYSDGFSKQASFDHPSAVTVDHHGFIYVADARNGRIRRIAPVGMIIAITHPLYSLIHVMVYSRCDVMNK
jgi:hypothetical protein